MITISQETACIIAEMIEGHRNSSFIYDPMIESELVEVSDLLYKLIDSCKITIEVINDFK